MYYDDRDEFICQSALYTKVPKEWKKQVREYAADMMEELYDSEFGVITDEDIKIFCSEHLFTIVKHFPHSYWSIESEGRY